MSLNIPMQLLYTIYSFQFNITYPNYYIKRYWALPLAGDTSFICTMLFKPNQGSPELTIVICDELWVVKGRMSTFSDIREIILLKDYLCIRQGRLKTAASGNQGDIGMTRQL